MCFAAKNVILTYAMSARVEYALKNVQMVINLKYGIIQNPEICFVIDAKKMYLKRVSFHRDARNATLIFAMNAF